MPKGAQIHPTTVVSPEASLGPGVSIGAFSVVHAGVSLGAGSQVDSHVLLGAPTADYFAADTAYEPATCSIGPGAVIRSHCVLYAGLEVGADFESGHHVTIREGARIGRGVRLGTLVDLQPEVTIGDHVRLHSNVFVARGSRIDELAWLFPHALLIDDPHPPSDTCTAGPTIRRAAVIGAQSMVYPAVEVGERAVVAAMSLVRQDVPADMVALGIPARIVGPAAEVECHEGRLEQVYPWWLHFRRGYPDGVLPEPTAEGR